MYRILVKPSFYESYKGVTNYFPGVPEDYSHGLMRAVIKLLTCVLVIEG